MKNGKLIRVNPEKEKTILNKLGLKKADGVYKVKKKPGVVYKAKTVKNVKKARDALKKFR